MKIKKDVQIAIAIVAELRLHDDYVRLEDLKIDSTISFLEQIAAKLSRADITTVKRGPGGGIKLASTLPISFYTIARALGEFKETILKSDHNSMNQLRKNIVEAYKNTKV